MGPCKSIEKYPNLWARLASSFLQTVFFPQRYLSTHFPFWIMWQMRDVVTLRNLTRRPFTDRASHRGDPADALSTTEPALSGDSVEGFDCAVPAVKDDPASIRFLSIPSLIPSVQRTAPEAPRHSLL